MKCSLFSSLILAFLLSGCQSLSPNRQMKGSLSVPTDSTFSNLLKAVDRDQDNKITIHDGKDLSFAVVDSKTKEKVRIDGHYPLSVLLQELTLAKDAKVSTLNLPFARLYEDPAERTSRVIRTVLWKGLTRRLDEEGLPKMIDPKAKTNKLYVYTPSKDREALRYYRSIAAKLQEKKIAVEITSLPIRIEPAYVRRLDGRHGILTLALSHDTKGKAIGALPFVIPGGRFNEMYGWDSYFIILGLLVDDHLELAHSMVENLVYEIENYGKILNANRTYYLNRSQPPFTTSAIRAVFNEMPATTDSKTWLRRMMKGALKEYKSVWTASPRRISEYGLSRYDGDGLGPGPEVEPGHYNHILAPYVGKAPFENSKTPEELYTQLTDKYRQNPRFRYPDQKLEDFFHQDRAVRESGHDTTFRFDDRATDFLTVDLNSLLYKTEADFLALIEAGLLPAGREFGTAAEWKARLESRKKKMYELMYDPQSGLFFDYDMKNKKRSNYISATTFYPLWAGLAEKEHAAKLKNSAFHHLLQPGGLAATASVSQQQHGGKPGLRQWEYPNGWAPHQILAWKGLENYGLYSDEKELIRRWTQMITDNARDYNGTIPEKYNVVTRSHAVFEEYGNVGTQFDYITREGFGWVNASYQLGRLRLQTK